MIIPVPWGPNSKRTSTFLVRVPYISSLLNNCIVFFFLGYTEGMFNRYSNVKPGWMSRTRMDVKNTDGCQEPGWMSRTRMDVKNTDGCQEPGWMSRTRMDVKNPLAAWHFLGAPQTPPVRHISDISRIKLWAVGTVCVWGWLSIHNFTKGKESAMEKTEKYVCIICISLSLYISTRLGGGE